MSRDVPHLVVCICTFCRPLMLERLLGELNQQLTGDAFTFSAVVADNDASQSARGVTEKFAKESTIALTYCVQPERNIALARNTAVSHACGEFLIFIDDDEFPAKEWLFNLFKTCQQHGVAGVLGPVLPYFDEEPPKWLRAGGFYDRPRHPTGFKLEWTGCRTGNVLFRKRVLEDLDIPFRAEFESGGEDQDFFRRALGRGHSFVWCDEAVVYEVVPPSRWKRRFMISRALLRGRNSIKHRPGRWGNIMKSVVAVPIYFVSLPLLSLRGHHYFMRNVVKLADHVGRLLAVLHLNPVSERRM